MSNSKRAFVALSVLAFTAGCSSDGGPSGPPAIVGAVSVSAGSDQSCAVGNSGGMACWGHGADSLGAVTVTTPIGIISISLSRALAGGSGCMVGSDHQAYCWGNLLWSDQGQDLGPGIHALAGMTSLNSISFGQNVICGTRTDNGVRCVGWYTGGGRGTDSMAAPDAFDFAPNGLHPVLSAYGTALATQFGCAVRTDSLVACWGTRGRGQLGGATGDTLLNCGSEGLPWCQPAPALVAGGAKYRQVAAWNDHACATRIDGGVDCWGRRIGATLTSSWDQACAPAADCLNVPTAVTLPSSAVRVVVGLDHACALLGTGAVYCWGSNDLGQLGRTGASSLTPVAVSGGFSFSAISAGSQHNCAIETGSGAVGCWGSNWNGQLGDGTLDDQDHPVAVVAAQ